MCTRVGFEVGVLQALSRQVRIDLCGGQVRMTEHLLQRAQVATTGEQVRGERVAQGVRRHLLGQARRARMVLDDLVEALTRE